MKLWPWGKDKTAKPHVEAGEARQLAGPRLEIDGEGVRRMLGETIVESAPWAELVGVSILTTEDGPLGEDFFWLLHRADGKGCAVPNELACEYGLLERLQRLPRFDNSAVIAASGSTERALFPCWEGAAGEGSVVAAVLGGE